MGAKRTYWTDAAVGQSLSPLLEGHDYPRWASLPCTEPLDGTKLLWMT